MLFLQLISSNYKLKTFIKIFTKIKAIFNNSKIKRLEKKVDEFIKLKNKEIKKLKKISLDKSSIFYH